MKFSSQHLSLDMALATDVGQVRQRNEDEVRVLPDAGAAILADGMGGHQAGDQAARLAVEIVSGEIQKHQQVSDAALAQWIDAANHAILNLAAANPAYHGMGTTVVVAVCQEGLMWFGHLGDSRLYRQWDDSLHQLTEDHTLVQQYINEGTISRSEAKTWAGRGLLLKGLGLEPAVVPSVGQSTLRPGQTYLLCSDGLTDPVTDEEIATILSHPGHSAQEAARALVDLANAHGAPDNVSVIVVRIHARHD